jgi:hypothetical protein
MGRLQEVPDAAGKVALEAADGLAGGLAFASFAVEVGLGFGVASGAGNGDPVQRGVELAVAAAVETVAVGLARADGRLDARRSLDHLMAVARDAPDDFPRYALKRFRILLTRARLDGLASEVPA